MTKTVFLISMFLTLTACSSMQVESRKSSEFKKLEREYIDHLKNVCVKDEVYSGIRISFHYTACLLDERALSLQLNLNRLYYLWSDEKFYQEKRNIEEKTNRNTLVFLSFYSPNRKLDDLSSQSSHWKSYLTNDEDRYEATAIKMANRYEDIKALYPSHTPWSTAYELKFDMPTRNLSKENVVFTLTGRLGFSQKSLINK